MDRLDGALKAAARQVGQFFATSLGRAWAEKAGAPEYASHCTFFIQAMVLAAARAVQVKVAAPAQGSNLAPLMPPMTEADHRRLEALHERRERQAAPTA